MNLQVRLTVGPPVIPVEARPVCYIQKRAAVDEHAPGPAASCR